MFRFPIRVQSSPHESTILLRRVFSSSSMTLNRKSNASVQPRLSASLVVVNHSNEVLLVQRNPNASAFGGMHVFPGGNFDENQDESLQMTAIRETFEESGLLLASTSHSSTPFPSDSDLNEARRAVHEQRVNFGRFLQTHGLRPDVNLLLPFTQWVTPSNLPRRFKTQFYLTFLPTTSGFPSGLREKLPTHDDRREIIEARFLHPETILKACLDGKIKCMPPQFYILSTLADFLSGPTSTPDQRKQVEDLSSGTFGKMTIIPRPLGRNEDGLIILALNGDETYGGPMGRQHRVLGTIIGNGLIVTSALIRNFAVAKEIETSTNDIAKL